MNKYLKILIILLLIVMVPILVLYGSLLFIVFYHDHTHYSEGTNLGSSEYYDRAVAKAGESGYMTEVYYVTSKEKDIHNSFPGALRPGAIEGLDPRLGSNYLVKSLNIYYSNSSWISISFLNSNESSVSFQTENARTEYKLEDLPEREWIAQKLKILFDLNEDEILVYLPAEICESHDGYFDQVTVNKTPDFAATHENFVGEATNSTFDAQGASGEGYCSETFYNESQKIGRINYIVPNAEISHREGACIYTIKIDRLGGMYLMIYLSPSTTEKTIPEDKYKAVFKKMFADLGLPPEKLDELKFIYTRGGGW
jgi:hypothetical protein